MPVATQQPILPRVAQRVAPGAEYERLRARLASTLLTDSEPRQVLGKIADILDQKEPITEETDQLAEKALTSLGLDNDHILVKTVDDEYRTEFMLRPLSDDLFFCPKG